jgi:hypothetical protein
MYIERTESVLPMVSKQTNTCQKKQSIISARKLELSYCRMMKRTSETVLNNNSSNIRISDMEDLRNQLASFQLENARLHTKIKRFKLQTRQS